LAADIRRHLHSEPVLAAPASKLYRTRKFVTRHRLAVSAAVLIAASLFLGAAVAAWQAEVASTQRARADVKAEEAQRQARQTEEQRNIAIRQRQRAEDESKLADGQRQLAMQQRQRAEEAARRAEKEQETASVERNRAVAAEAQAIEARNRALTEKGRADTEAANAEAVNNFLRFDLLANAGADTQARPDVSPDRDLKVRTALDRAAGRIQGRFNTRPLIEAAIRQTIGNAYNELGLYPEAQLHLERALAIRSRVLGEDDPSTVSVMFDLANNLYRRQAKYAEAEQLFLKVLAVQRRVLGEENSVTLETMNRLADLYRFQRRYSEAEALFNTALAGFRRLLGEHHYLTLDTMNNLALIYRGQGKYAKSEELLLKSLDGCRHALGEEHPETLIIANNLATVYRSERRYTDAESLLLRVLETRRRVLGDDHLDTRDSMHDLAVLYSVQGRYLETEELLNRLIAINRRVLGNQDPRTINVVSFLASVYLRQHKNQEVEPLLTEIVDVRRRTLGENHPSVLLSMTNLATVYLDEHDFKHAETCLRHVLAGYEITAIDGWRRYRSQSLLGTSLVGQQRYPEAEPLVISGYEGLVQRQTSLPRGLGSELADAADRIAQLYRAWGKPWEAARWSRKVEEIKAKSQEVAFYIAPAEPGSADRVATPIPKALTGPPQAASAAVTAYLGDWKNVDPDTKSITRFSITGGAAKLFVHAWGSCHPMKCDWHEAAATSVDQGLSVVWDQGFATRFWGLSLEKDGRLRLQQRSHYTDGRDRGELEFFTRSPEQRQ
jgi:tetratricopeptide (TPR) repeat protein